MVNSCCIYGCKENFVKGGSITFHRFPQNEKCREMWEKAIGRKQPYNTATICSKHFKKGCFYNSSVNSMRLKTGAVPTELLGLDSTLANTNSSMSSDECPLEMAANQDRVPNNNFQKDAEEFQTKFDKDIRECSNFLNAKVTAFICNHDSFGTPGDSIHQNNVPDFLRSKYETLTAIKSFINGKEQEWLDSIAQMKGKFIENIEMFFAETKSEVPLLPPESVSHSSLSNILNGMNSLMDVTSNSTAGRYKKRKRLSYIGDFNNEILVSPAEAKKLMSVVQKKARIFSKTVKSLRQRNRRLNKRVESLKQLIIQLKRTPQMSKPKIRSQMSKSKRTSQMSKSKRTSPMSKSASSVFRLSATTKAARKLIRRALIQNMKTQLFKKRLQLCGAITY